MMRRIGLIAGLSFLLAIGATACKSDSGAKKGEEAEAEQPSEEGEEHPGDEHPGEGHNEGEEHPGDEHPGEGHEEGEEHPGDEHPGDEHPGDEAKKKKKKEYSAADIKKAMKAHIKSEEKDGVFKIKDKKEGETLELKFVKIHDPVRKMEGKGYFGCTDFQVDGAEDKVYDLDFWLKPKDGELKVTKSKVHKHPVKKDGSWEKKARYTFKDDEVTPLD